jgi:hypothetical protein
VPTQEVDIKLRAIADFKDAQKAAQAYQRWQKTASGNMTAGERKAQNDLFTERKKHRAELRKQSKEEAAERLAAQKKRAAVERASEKAAENFLKTEQREEDKRQKGRVAADEARVKKAEAERKADAKHWQNVGRMNYQLHQRLAKAKERQRKKEERDTARRARSSRAEMARLMKMEDDKEKGSQKVQKALAKRREDEARDVARKEKTHQLAVRKEVAQFDKKERDRARQASGRERRQRDRDHRARVLGIRATQAMGAVAGHPQGMFASIGPGLGALAGGLIGAVGGGVGGFLQGAGTALSSSKNPWAVAAGGVLGGIGGMTRAAAEALAPAAEAVITMVFERAQGLFNTFVQFQRKQMGAFPMTGRVRSMMSFDWRDFTRYTGFTAQEGATMMGQIAGAAGFDPFSGGVGYRDRRGRELRMNPELWMGEIVRRGVDPGVMGRVTGLYRPGGGLGGPPTSDPMWSVGNFIDSSIGFGGLGRERGYAPQMLNRMMGQWAGTIEGMGARGIDLPQGGWGLMGDVWGLSGIRGLEGERATQFQSRMINQMANVAGGGGDPLTQYMLLGAAMAEGAQNYPEMIRMLETGQVRAETVLSQYRSLGPRGAFVMSRGPNAIAGSFTQAERILAGEEAPPFAGGGPAGGGWAGWVPGGVAVEAGVETERTILGEQLLPAAADLAEAFLNIDATAGALVMRFKPLLEILPAVTARLADMAGGSAGSLGLMETND